MLRRKETMKYQKSAILDVDGVMNRAKEDTRKSYVDKDDMLGPDYAQILVSPDQFFFHHNVRTRQEGDFHPNTLFKLHIDWLKIDGAVKDKFDSEDGFVSQFINSSVIAFDTYTYLNLKKRVNQEQKL